MTNMYNSCQFCPKMVERTRMARFNLAPLPAPCACVKKKSGTVCRRGRFVAGTVHGRGGRFVAETIRGGDGLWQGTIHGGDS